MSEINIPVETPSEAPTPTATSRSDRRSNALPASRNAAADQFSYVDPVDGSVSKNQGVRIAFENGCRGVIRLSGTGTDGATVRMYLEQFTPFDGDLGMDTQTALLDVAQTMVKIAKLPEFCDRQTPDIMT